LACMIGLGVMSMIGALLLRSWRKPSSQFSRPMALVAGTYALSIVTLRATTPFDSVSSPRTFLPALFPLVYLVVTQARFSNWKTIRIAACLSLLLSVALACRGMSPEQRKEESSVRDCLAGVLIPEDTVAVNGAARNLAAYFPNRFTHAGATWTVSSSWDPAATALTVVGPSMRGATLDSPGFDTAELECVQAAIDSGRVRLVCSTPSSIVVRSLPEGR